MYVIISNLVMGEIDILRDVPEDCGDIEQYLKDILHYDTNHIQWFTAENDTPINYFDVKNNEIILRGYDYIENKF